MVVAVDPVLASIVVPNVPKEVLAILLAILYAVIFAVLPVTT